MTMLQAHEYPNIGTWYWDINQKTRFEVVAKDEANDMVEIQLFSGEIEEVDLDTWFSMQLISIAAPKDWSGPFEVDKEEFTELGDETIHPTLWSPFNTAD